MNYVKEYLRLEDRATGAESRSRSIAHALTMIGREQCRIAHEAMDSGRFSPPPVVHAGGRA